MSEEVQHIESQSKLYSFFQEERKYVFKEDGALWAIWSFLTAISLVAVYSASSMLMSNTMLSTFSILVKQVIYVCIGLAFMLLTASCIRKWTPNILKKIAFFMYMVSIVLLILTFIPPFRVEINGAARWISFLGITIQPSEFVKMTLIVYLASVLSDKRELLAQDSKESNRAFLIILALIAVSVGLIILSNLSTAILLTIISFVMLVVGHVPFKKLKWLLFIGVAGVAILGTLIYTCPEPATKVLPRLKTWQTRIVSYIPSLEEKIESEDGTRSVNVDNYQVTQAKIAIHEGKILGKGPGNSMQRYHLSQAYCDFIYAIIIEETGWLGAISVLFLYIILFARTLFFCNKTEFHFDALVLFGITFTIVCQALIHMLVVVGAMPATGQTLPFISSGGTSLIFSSIEFGIILGIVSYTKRRREKKMKTEEANS